MENNISNFLTPNISQDPTVALAGSQASQFNAGLQQQGSINQQAFGIEYQVPYAIRYDTPIVITDPANSIGVPNVIGTGTGAGGGSNVTVGPPGPPGPPGTGGGSPGGSDKSVQFNNLGAFGGDPGYFEYDVNTGILGIYQISNILNSGSPLTIVTQDLDATDSASINIQTGPILVEGTTGDIVMRTGSDTVDFSVTGNVIIATGGAGKGANSGNVDIVTGSVTDSSASGDILIQTGQVNAGTSGSTAGRIRILGGDIGTGNNSNAGTIVIQAGLSTGTSAGDPSVTIQGGSRSGTGKAGTVNILGGAGVVSGNAAGGDVFVVAGDGRFGGTGTGGNIVIAGGHANGTGAGGDIVFELGSSSGSPTLMGNFAINNSIIAPGFGGGQGIIYIVKDSVNPSSDPVGGIFLYVDSGGNLKARGSSGTITTVAAA